jgi:conjugative relaxase-like TrwC/TraI family protein
MLTIKAIADDAGFLSRYLAGDYYNPEHAPAGQWMGRGARLLGLEGKVSIEQFDAIREGLDPATGNFLRPRHSAPKFDREGKQVASGRNLYDFTISAPKAVSVQALEDPRLIEAHGRAVIEAITELENLVCARVRKLGANDNRVTGNLVLAVYQHDTSRELDPQLHTHCVAGNLTYDGTEGRWKALAPYGIWQRREYLTEVYRNALARKVTSLGYQIEDRFEHGKDRGFGIAGIPESTLEKYSQRSAQRDQAVAEFRNENGRLPGTQETTRLIRETRAPKLVEITAAEVKARQLARMDEAEARTLQQLRQVALDRGSAREQAPASLSLGYAREHTFERVSVAKDYELKTEALRHGRGRIELPELQGALLSEVAAGSILTARGEVATRESLERERLMVATINEGIAQYQPLGRSCEFVVSDRLRPEQKTAVEAALDSRDLAVNLRGAAGTGKTATLQELHRGLREARRTVVAVAPTASAVEELRKVGFPEAMTVARLLADPQQQQELAGQVLIVDEAGMVGSKDMAALLDVARTKGARIVFSGDTAQIKSVSEGDALRVLERESKLKSVSLLEVQRQTNAEYKAAVETLRHNPAEGFRQLEAMGAIREVEWRLRAQEVSKAYREAAAVPNAKGQARSVLVVAATHDEIKSITYAIRAERQRSGELEKGETFPQHRPLHWTAAQKKECQNYRPGMVLEFHKAVKDVAKNEALEVISAERGAITARKGSGESVRLSARQAKAFAVFERQGIEVSAGDKLLLEANWRDKDFRATNGELVTVASVAAGSIQLQDGRQLPAGYRQFTHGYAVTAHRSQGKTVDFEILAAERMAHDLFYVSATRAREGLTVITSDSVALQESIGVSGDRQSASELARRVARVFEPEDFQLYEQVQQQERVQRVQERRHERGMSR